MHRRVEDRMKTQDEKIRDSIEKQRSIDRKITASLVFTIITLISFIVAVGARAF